MYMSDDKWILIFFADCFYKGNFYIEQYLIEINKDSKCVKLFDGDGFTHGKKW